MRTTVTLDPDTEQMIRHRMKRRGISFKRALNESIRDGNLSGRTSPATRPFPLGQPAANLDRALQVAGELEDEELLARMQRGA